MAKSIIETKDFENPSTYEEVVEVAARTSLSSGEFLFFHKKTQTLENGRFYIFLPFLQKHLSYRGVQYFPFIFETNSYRPNYIMVIVGIKTQTQNVGF